ncbi:hypothetical protein [Moraxella oblonga]|uniref:hypothetical protein n=1 Tax=Moraxella oblonga TaxID=200413 RepID=UPI0008331F56|nr:hypothetical protein [Moraxella oblonga]
MKKLLKLSATALILAGANVLFSQSALACNSTDFACQQQQQIQWQLQNDPNYCHYGYNPNCGNNRGGYGYSSGYRVKYLGLFRDRNYKPYFVRKSYISSDGYLDFEQADGDGLAECNKSSKRAPCETLASVKGSRGCIAYLDTPQVLYSYPAETCREAKQIVNDRCMARYNDLNTCKGIKSKEL